MFRPPPPKGKPSPYGSAKPLTKEPNGHRGRSYDCDKDKSRRPSILESRGLIGRRPLGEKFDHTVLGSRPKLPKPRI